MHLSLNAVACAMRTKNSGVQGRRARSARYAGCADVMCFDLDHLFSLQPFQLLCRKTQPLAVDLLIVLSQ